VDDENILLLPDGLDPIQAAAIGNSGVAAYTPLVEIAGIGQDDTVLILGATGAVGQIAVQIAKAKGVARVVGIGRDRAVLNHLKSLGADAVVELRAGEAAVDLTDRLHDVAGAVNVILDGLYGMPLEAALQVCTSKARVVNIGHSAGATASIPAGVLRGKQLALFGFAGLHTPLKEKQLALSWLWAALQEGTLRVNTMTVSLEELPEAWRRQATSPHGKYVLLPSQAEESRP
jgi:NADPH2:quinone reductase